MEGIVAGVPSLSDYDVILDAGTSGKEGGDSVAPYDLTLPDGRVLTKPGNIFGVLEAAMWGTESEYVIKGPVVDYDGNGTQDFGDVMPDANVLKSAAEALDKYSIELLGASKKWQPTISETFSALVGNVPTIGEFFESWKASRFVSGDKSEQHDFVAISRLSDIVDNITSWQTIYQGISSQGKQADADLDSQIIKGMSDLKTYVQDLKQQEAGGKRFTPEQAELLGEEAQTRATALTGLITQMAAKLNVKIEQK
jgi:hypothetical protein